MGSIEKLAHIDYLLVILGFFAILFAAKEIIEIFSYFKKKFRIKTGSEEDKETIENRIKTLEKHDNWQYQEILKDPYFQPVIEEKEQVMLPAKMRWGGSEDADGVAVDIKMEGNPEFFEINFEEELNIMMEINGKWFYKAPETKTVDLMPAFFESEIKEGQVLTLKMFAPPATGENDESQGDDWAVNYYTEMKKMPELRIRYEAVEDL